MIRMREIEMTVSRRYRVWGRVQGVGFRAFVWGEARDLGLDGWVRNRFDGSVELVARGSQEGHRLLLESLERGPRISRVDRVDVSDDAVDGGVPDGFEIWNDA